MRKLLVFALVAVLLAVGAVPAYAALSESLSSEGPTSVEGTSATAVFDVGDRHIREVRYVDRSTLTYSFTLVNDGRLPVTVKGLAPLPRKPTLLTYKKLEDANGDAEFTIGVGDRKVVRLSMLMTACERLSARAGSFATEVRLRISRLGVIDKIVTVDLPEELHTGSAREALCPKSTSDSRPPG